MLRIKPGFQGAQAPQVLPPNEEQRLLIVDDEHDILLTLHELFAPYYSVRTAESGAKALAIIESGFIPQVILADQRMQGMSGTEFLTQTIAVVPQTVRVVLTGYTDVQDLADSINQGNVYRFLTKPWRNADLLEIIRVCFQHYYLSEEKIALTHALERLEYISNEKTEILSLIAHDLKNPLTTIIGMADIIVSGQAGTTGAEPYQQYGEDIRNTAERMNKLVQSLLDVHALEEGKLHVNLVGVEAAPILKLLVDGTSHIASTKEIILRYEAETNASILIDEVWFYQIIENLLSNAIKYSPPGATVTMRVNSESDNVFIRVSDEGPGISDQEKTKLFQRFAKLSARPTGGENSTGLGLAIVKKLIELMDGNVWCESNLDVGATFILQLPVHIPKEESVLTTFSHS